jgi:glycosyltransferase involved in cell wall biosynthesis
VTTEHRALVLTTSAAGRAASSGASLRVADVCAALAASGFEPEVLQRRDLPAAPRACLGVAVSYAVAPALRSLRARTGPLWLDAVDSWLAVDLSGLRAGHPSYAARLVRDGLQLGTAPTVDLLTYISDADRRTDRSTVRGLRRWVLPGLPRTVDLLPQQEPRAVLAGDWGYTPNRGGLHWFSRYVLPQLELLRPEPSWRIDVYGLHAPVLEGRMRVHGYAHENELYRHGDVHLAPVRHGGGVKRKVLQALLAGLPVVTTAAGARGLRPHDLLDVTTSASAFAEAAAARLGAETIAPRPSLEHLVDADDRPSIAAWLKELAAACRH